MASDIPPSLKVVAPFIVKAHQMEKADPIISYFCYVYTVQQALAKGLTKSADGMAYTGHVMDTLEQRRAELSDHEAVADELVGKAYVEQFGNKIFSNAENAQNARRCTKQTAETFMAASVFLELLRVFGELDPEISKKITFAKYSAARILKALKAGEDPNPPIEEQPEEDEVPPVFTDMDGPKIQRGVSPVSPVSPHPPAPTVEDAVDDAESFERSMARISAADESLHPSRMVTPNNIPPPPPLPSFPFSPETEAPLRPATHIPSRTETMSTTEPFPTQNTSPGYFPQAPYAHETSVAPSILDLPSAPPNLPAVPSSFPSSPPPSIAPSAPPSAPFLPPKSPPVAVSPQPPAVPDGFYSGASASAGLGTGAGFPSSLDAGFNGPPPHWLGHTSPPPPSAPPMGHQTAPGPSYHYAASPVGAPQPPQRQPYTQAHASPFQRAPPVQPAPAPQRKLADPDEDPAAIKEAHKCIRWADSALNFDDVPTAVKQLRLALRALGAE